MTNHSTTDVLVCGEQHGRPHMCHRACTPRRLVPADREDGHTVPGFTRQRGSSRERRKSSRTSAFSIGWWRPGTLSTTAYLSRRRQLPGFRHRRARRTDSRRTLSPAFDDSAIFDGTHHARRSERAWSSGGIQVRTGRLRAGRARRHGARQEAGWRRAAPAPSYLVGADGSRGFVRRALGVDFPGKTLGVRAIVADVVLTGLDRDAWHRFSNGAAERLRADRDQRSAPVVSHLLAAGQALGRVHRDRCAECSRRGAGRPRAPASCRCCRSPAR